nr:hypothetical protein [Tanacetum cinerariifolium]
MDTKINQQVVRDEALVPHAKRLRIGRSNFCLLSDIKSKESTLQLVYDVLRLTPFFKAFLVTANVLEIYMQEFWVTATVHHHSIRFKMDNKKRIVNLESFREMLHICPRLPHQPFVEPPFVEEILAFLHFLGHNAVTRKLTDVEYKDTKKSNEMYYPRFTKVIIHHFMSKDPSIPRRNKFGALLPIKLTNEDIKNSNAYKEYYAVSTGVTPPKPKASVWKTRSIFDITVTPPTATAGPRLTTSEKDKQAAKASKAKSLSALSEDDEGDEEEDDEEEGSDDGQAFDEEEFIYPGLSTHAKEETRDEESFDPILKTPKNSDDEGNGEENLGINVGREEGHDEEEEEDELYKDQNSSVSSQFVTSMLNPTPDAGMESIFETTSQMDAQTPALVAPLPKSAPTFTSSTIATITTTQQAPLPPTTALSTLLQDLPNFGSLFRFDHRLKTLEENFSEFMQTNQFAGPVSAIPEIVQRYMDQQMNKAVKTIDENMQKIIKEQVKEQVKVQVSKILPKIEQTMNEQLEAEVLTQSSNSSKTSYTIAADLSEMEFKKIPIEKIEGNKSIHRSNKQRNLYKALVDAYESDKIILDTYGDTVTLKRRRNDDADKDEEPSAGPDRGSKRRREGKEPESASAPQETATRSAGRSTQGSKSRQTSTSEFAIVEEPLQTTFEIEEPSHPEFDTCADDQPIVESVDTLTLELLAGPTYELMKGSWKSLVELEYQLEEVYKATTDQLDWVNPEANYGHIKWIEDLVPRTIWIQEPIGYDKHALWGISHWGRKRQQFYSFAVNRDRRMLCFNVSLQMFTRSIVIQRRVEDLQLGVESYQKKLNLTKLDTYRSDLKRKEAYIVYSNLRGFIYQNKDKKNRLMRIDELHKFSDGTLSDVCTALDDRLKGIQMQYLPQSIWRKSDKDRAAAMIQAIDKRIKTKRIMRSLERFVGGRLYEGDFRMIQRTI